jgi:hypothetical protein
MRKSSLTLFASLQLVVYSSTEYSDSYDHLSVPNTHDGLVTSEAFEMATADMEEGQRVEVRLHRGAADVWYGGTVVDAHSQRVRLDSGTELEGEGYVDADTIAEWRPMRTSPDVSEA